VHVHVSGKDRIVPERLQIPPTHITGGKHTVIRHPEFDHMDFILGEHVSGFAEKILPEKIRKR
jgi:hypothetical protein